MARSTYIYVVTHSVETAGGLPVMARTVKYELVNALTHFTPAMLDDVEVWRMYDRGSAYDPADRSHLGNGTEFLAKANGDGA